MTRSKNQIDTTTASSTSILWTNDKLGSIRKAVAQVLQLAVATSDAEHGRALLGHFVAPLNSLIGGVELDGETATFTEGMIQRAFLHNRTSSFADCNHVTGANVDGVLHIRAGKQGTHRSAETVYDIGFFPDMESASRMIGCNNADNSKPSISKSKLRTIKLDNVCESVIDKLRSFAIKEKKRAAYAKDTVVNKRRKIDEEEEDEDWGWSGGGGEIDEEDENEEENIKSLRLQVVEDKARVDTLYARMEELHKEFQEANKKFEMSSAALNEAVSSSSSAGLADDMLDLNTNCKKYAIYGDTVGSTSSAENRISVHYYLGGVAGVAEFSGPASNRVITEADLKRGFLPVPVDANKTKKNNADKPTTDNTPRAVNFETQCIAGSLYFIPSYHELSARNQKAIKERKKQLVDNMVSLFDKNRSTWGTDAKRIFTAMNAFGYGCSDEGTLFTMGGTLSGLFKEVGMEIDAEQIFRTPPSRSTLGNWEADVATDCLFALCWQLKEAGVKQLGITTDHGHRKGQDHLVKLLSFPTLTSTGEHTIDFLCLNVDSAGHTTEEASSAISTDVEELLEILRQFLGPDVKLSVITGDAGGGASVQNLHPALITKGTMDAKSKRLSCDMHNLNKALETACIDTWGRQGIGHKTPFQMVWLFVRILKHIRKDMGRKNVDEAWAATVESLRKDPSWQLTASEKCDVAFKDFLSRLDKLEGGDDDDRNAAEKIASKASANIQDPVNTRWGTTQAGFKLFADNWPVIYFFVRTLLIGEKSNSHLHIMCCALLSLMHNTELPTIHDNLNNTQPTNENDDDTGLDAYLNTFGADGMELNDATIAEMDGIAACPATPLFLAVTHFLNGFNECFFAGM